MKCSMQTGRAYNGRQRKSIHYRNTFCTIQKEAGRSSTTFRTLRANYRSIDLNFKIASLDTPSIRVRSVRHRNQAMAPIAFKCCTSILDDTPTRLKYPSEYKKSDRRPRRLLRLRRDKRYYYYQMLLLLQAYHHHMKRRMN